MFVFADVVSFVSTTNIAVNEWNVPFPLYKVAEGVNYNYYEIVLFHNYFSPIGEQPEHRILA